MHMTARGGTAVTTLRLVDFSPMRYVVIYADDQGTKHTQHVHADSPQLAYDAVEVGYDAKHGEGAFRNLKVGVGIAADPNFSDPGIVGSVAARLAGSADIYQCSGHLPINSVNFINCHDGFTLNDLVSYNDKHNEDNGEANRDGINENLSWNCGWEGATDAPDIETLRGGQIKNFATILMLSRGVPMFVAGDEVRRTQKGNNNAYCQDNEISWFDWRLAEENRSLLRFWKLLIAARPHFRAGRPGRFFKGEVNERGLPDVVWHGTQLNKPGWNDPNARCLAYTLGGFDGHSDLHAMLNMYWGPLDFEVPIVPGRRWYRIVDTARPSPEDIVETARQVPIEGHQVRVEGRSVLVLLSR